MIQYQVVKFSLKCKPYNTRGYSNFIILISLNNLSNRPLH